MKTLIFGLLPCLVVLALIPAIALNKEPCNAEYSGKQATQEYGITPSRVILSECCKNPQTIEFSIENYTDTTRAFEVQGAIIAVEPHSSTRVSCQVTVNSITRVYVSEITDDTVKVRLTLKITKEEGD